MYTKYFSRLVPALILSSLILIALTLTNTVYAQGGSAGVGIIPATIEPAEHFEPGQAAEFSVKVSNLSDADQTYFLSKRDIVGVQDGGIPIFAKGDFELTGFELSEWITLSVEEVQIPARGSVDVPFTITVPQEVSPGSHFGSIIISVEPPKMRSSGASIGYEVANIISLRVAGDARESARIRQFSTSKYIYGTTNVEFKARIENEGNTLIRPTGPLEVVNMFGKRVAVLDFNESKAGIFPKTAQSDGLKEYVVTWEDESPGFGRYEALLSVVYGGEGNMNVNNISSTVTFWILPMSIITPALIALTVLFVVIWVSVKVYVRRSMVVANGGVSRRLVRSRQQNQFPTLLVIITMLAVSALFFIILLALFA